MHGQMLALIAMLQRSGPPVHPDQNFELGPAVMTRGLPEGPRQPKQKKVLNRSILFDVSHPLASQYLASVSYAAAKLSGNGRRSQGPPALN